jgi:hypothetical protein
MKGARTRRGHDTPAVSLIPNDPMLEPHDPSAPPAAPADDLDAQCRGIGTRAAPSANPSARAAYGSGPAAGVGVPADVPVARLARRGGRHNDGPAERRA